MAEILEIKVKASGIEEAYKGIENLTNALKELKKVYAGGNWLKEMASAFQTIGNAMSNATKGSAGKKEKPKFSPDEELGKKYENLSKRELLQKKLAASRGKLYDMAGQKPIDDGKLAEQASKVQRLKKELADFNKEAKQPITRFRKLSSTFSSLGRAMGRIALYRALRTAIKEIGKAFSEGLQNAYHFSKGINGSLAQALDTISTKSQTMENQLGAAFGSLIQAVAPILLKIINLVTRAANAIAQLFASFSGSTYLKAKDSFKEWADSASAGAAATEEWKNQLMGFDEINRLDEPTSSGGGGGGGTNYADMFEVAEINPKIIKAAEWLKDHLKEILTIVTLIKLTIDGWNFLSKLGNISNLNIGFKKLLGLTLALWGAVILVKEGIDAWINGIDWENLKGMLIGVTGLTAGLGLAFGAVGAAVGLLVGGIALLVLGFREWIKTGELSNETLAAIVIGLLAVGAAVSLLTGSWIPIAIAAVASIAVVVVKYWDEIKSGIARAINSIIDCLNKLLSFFNRIGQFFGAKGTFQIGHVSFGSTSGYATGGFPEDGLFYANHNELVGQFSNGKTAVANNEQIISGIRQGVYEATLAAINNGNLPTAQDVRESRSDFYLDGKMISKSLNKYSRAMGT